ALLDRLHRRADRVHRSAYRDRDLPVVQVAEAADGDVRGVDRQVGGDQGGGEPAHLDHAERLGHRFCPTSRPGASTRSTMATTTASTSTSTPSAWRAASPRVTSTSSPVPAPTRSTATNPSAVEPDPGTGTTTSSVRPSSPWVRVVATTEPTT